MSSKYISCDHYIQTAWYILCEKLNQAYEIYLLIYEPDPNKAILITKVNAFGEEELCLMDVETKRENINKGRCRTEPIRLEDRINFASGNLYLASTNELLILPLLSTIRYYVFSYDVIHSLSIYSFGIKVDAIPTRFNTTGTVRTLIKGKHRGLCYELCGLGHNTMLINVDCIVNLSPQML